MPARTLTDDLDLWRAHRDGDRPAQPAELRDLLDRLQTWKAEHDRDRAAQPGPFLKMVWDGIFGDDDGAVEAAIAELQAALS